MDSDVFRAEARRLARIASGERPQCHQYPDLMHWEAPRSRADSLMQTEHGALFVSGLGLAEDMGKPVLKDSKRRFRWQWVQLEFGQTLLIKRREKLAEATPNCLPRGRLSQRVEEVVNRSQEAKSGISKDVRQVSRPAEFESGRHSSDDRVRRVMQTVSQLQKHIGDPNKIVSYLRRVAINGEPDEVAGVFSALPELFRESAPRPGASADIGKGSTVREECSPK